MHDSVNALTLEDEKRMLAYLINGFIKMVSFGRDFEQQLSFYVEARSMFCNLEPVLVQLIHVRIFIYSFLFSINIYYLYAKHGV